MFSFFSKRIASPQVEENEGPPIPGPRADDSFVVVNPALPPGGIYPNVSGMGGPAYPQRPAPPVPRTRSNDQTFHYLQGVPFSMSRELQMASNKDSFAIEIGDLLAFVLNKIKMSNYEYPFSVERSVIKEC